MATVYPINAYGGSASDPNASQPLYENPGGAYPVQPSTGYAQGYYLPPGGMQPGQVPPGQAVYPMYNPSIPVQGGYPTPQAYTGVPPPGHGVPYGAAPLASNPPAYPMPTAGGVQPVVVYPMAVPQPSTGAQKDPASDFTMREWSVGLCGCCHNCFPNLFMAWCCPCISLAQIYARLGLATYNVALVRFLILFASGIVFRFVPIGSGTSSRRRAVSSVISVASGDAKTMSGTVWYAFLAAQQLVFIVAIAIARRRTRHRFKIPGNRCIDGLVSLLCPCCTIAQIATQIKSYKPGSCNFSGPDVLPAFQ